MRRLAVAILLLMILSISCTTTKYIEVPVEIETIKTEYINQLYKDSIYIHDSIDRYISGDTVYLYKQKYIYRYLNKTDTIVNEIKTEIPVEIKTIEVKEVNKLKWYQSILVVIGGISTALILVFLGGLIYKLFIKK